MIFNYVVGFNIEKAKIIEDVINKYQIDQIHIHQFDCIPYVFPACIYTNKPYIAYVHTGIEGTYDWFEEHYFDYKGIFEIYFKMSSKIICITESAKKENMKKYKLSEEKYLVVNNSIKFDNEIINNETIPNKIEKFLIISRLNEEKRISLINALNIFRQYSIRHDDARLTIVGDGNIKNDIEKEIKDIKDKVTLLGKRTDTFKILLEHDILIGLDRCILEAIVSKRLAIVSGYSEIKGIVLPENIKEFQKENFSGKELKSTTIKNIVQELEKMDFEKIKQIVEANYNYAYENLNIDKNIYVFNGKKDEYTLNIEFFLKHENYLVNKATKLEEEKHFIYSESKKMQEYYEQQISNIKNEVTEKTQSINELKTEVEKYKKLYNQMMKKEERKRNKNIIHKIYNRFKKYN